VLISERNCQRIAPAAYRRIFTVLGRKIEVSGARQGLEERERIVTENVDVFFFILGERRRQRRGLVDWVDEGATESGDLTAALSAPEQQFDEVAVGVTEAICRAPDRLDLIRQENALT
jgi:hypothetical protein